MLQLFSTIRYSKNNCYELKRLKNVDDEIQEWSLTAEKIRSVAGYENTTDDDIELIIRTFTLLALAFYESELNKK